MRSCGKRLLIVFAIVQLAKCIYSQEQDGIDDTNAERNVLLMEQVEGLETQTSKKTADYETTLNPTVENELNPTTAAVTETINISKEENDLTTQSEATESSSDNPTVETELNPTFVAVTETINISNEENDLTTQSETTENSGKDELGTLTTEMYGTEEPAPQAMEKPKCLCDCDTGDILKPEQIEQCASVEPEKQDEAGKKDAIEESVLETTSEIETTEQITVTDEPRTTEINASMGNPTESTIEPQTAAPTMPLEDTPTYSLTEAPIASPTEPPTETETESQTAADPVETTTSHPVKPCAAAGDFPVEGNCQLYYTCVAAQPVETTTLYERVEKSCPSGNAYNSELGRCTRDISSCPDGSQPCEQPGTFSDPQGNTSYYWCVARLNGGIGGFHKYRVQCPTGEIYVAQLGKCFIDINNLQNLPTNWGQAGESDEDDEDIIKAELKQFKLAEKTRLKEQKLKDKMEQKLQKELAKKAAKEAKEQAKLQGASKELEEFVCTAEGNFAATLSTDRYFACISKKGKFKLVSMKCALGNVFDAARSACISNDTDSDDDEDDD